MADTTTIDQLANLTADIPHSLALSAHQGTSFVPEKRADEVRHCYAAGLAGDYAEFRQFATEHGTLDQLEGEFNRYREGYRRRYTAWLSSRSRLVSTMIAGPANFPAERMRKRGDTAHRRLEELLSFRDRAKRAIRRKLHPGRMDGAIMTSDDDAAEQLEQKIAAAERRQTAWKAANKIVRRKPKNEPTPEKLVELMELGFSPENAEELFRPDYAGRIGVPGYQLTNNNANIRRMKQRLEQVRKAKATPDSEQQGAHATLEDCPSANRVRLFFPGKPPAEVRAKLKSNGFRWARSLGCWQAYRNPQSLAIAPKLAGVGMGEEGGVK